MEGKRESWVDSWKGILIFLVVLGHVVGMACHYASGETGRFMALCYKWIYLFHMPAFFVVVGMMEGLKVERLKVEKLKGLKVEELKGFNVSEVSEVSKVQGFKGSGVEELKSFKVSKLQSFKVSEVEELKGFVGKRAKRLLVPYFFWGVVSILIFWGMMTVVEQIAGKGGYYGHRMIPKDWWQPFVSLLHAGGWPRGEGFRCNSVLWFLPVMFGTLISFKVSKLIGFKVSRFQSFKVSEVSRLVITGVAFLVIGGVMRFYVGMLPWGLDRVPRFLAFVYVGEIVASFKVSKFLSFRVSEVSEVEKLKGFKVEKLKGFKVEKLKSLGVFVVCAGVLTWGTSVFPDLGMAFHRWKWYFAEAGLAVVGSVMTLALARLIDCRLLAGMGVASLGIMVTHKFPIVFLQSVVGKFEWFGAFGRFEMAAAALGIAVVVTAVCWAVAGFVRRWVPWSC